MWTSQGFASALWSTLSAYADDLLFYLSASQISLPALMSEVHKFGLLSNFKVWPFTYSRFFGHGYLPATLLPLYLSFSFYTLFGD